MLRAPRELPVSDLAWPLSLQTSHSHKLSCDTVGWYQYRIIDERMDRVRLVKV